MKKALAIFLVLVLASCSGALAASASDKPIGDGLKAAMILPGPISDPGFSGPAYEGLLRMEKELGYEISFAESVAAADYENVFRTYAQHGYNIIFAHGSQFLETALTVAKDFPDTWFAVSSGFQSNGTNVSGWNLSSNDVGFLGGALMAQMSVTRKLGMVSGMEIPPIAMIFDGMRAGAAYIDPDISVHNVYTSATADSAQCKEASVALIDAGCDLLSSSAGVGSPGVIAACKEKNLLFVGTSADWAPIDPDTVLNSIVTDWGGAAFNTAELYAKKELQPRPYMNGIAEGAVYLVGYGALDAKVPAEVKARMDEIVSDIKSGKINIADLVAALPK